MISTLYLRAERLTLQVITTFILSPQAPVYKTFWFFVLHSHRSGWAESVFWWSSSWLLQSKFSCFTFSNLPTFVSLAGAPSKSSDTQSCSLSAQALPPQLFQLLQCAMYHQLPWLPALGEKGGQSALMEHSWISQMLSRLSWRRVFGPPRSWAWTGRASSCSTGSPPPPFPPQPPSPPPSV